MYAKNVYILVFSNTYTFSPLKIGNKSLTLICEPWPDWVNNSTSVHVWQDDS